MTFAPSVTRGAGGLKFRRKRQEIENWYASHEKTLYVIDGASRGSVSNSVVTKQARGELTGSVLW